MFDLNKKSIRCYPNQQQLQRVNKYLYHPVNSILFFHSSLGSVEAKNRKQKQDNFLFYIYAFFSYLNCSKRILRVFANINLVKQRKVFNNRKSFKDFIAQLCFLTHQKALDYLHNTTKRENKYQANVKREKVVLKATCVWSDFYDNTHHDTIFNRRLLEQTIYLNYDKMKDAPKSPLKILENKL